ncbi:MAG: glycosyltransferase family 4 protein [Rhizobium sp.]|nr:glycosyltransferase family 4 protein [Rhizobium sp.]
MASTSYPRDEQDWRGVFIRAMTDALARRDDVEMRVWCPPGPLPANVGQAATSEDTAWLDALSKVGGIAMAIRRRNLAGLLAGVHLLHRLRKLYQRESDVDLVHANWLQTALPLPRNGKPLLATVLGTDYKLLGIPGLVSALRHQFTGRAVALCPNADWMVPGLQKHFGDLAIVRCVPFGINKAYFDLERKPVRPAHWICVSRITRPKIGDLFNWCETSFRSQCRELHLFGPMQEPIQIPEWVHYHGPVSQTDLLDQLLPKATGLISLSRHPEGRPQIMLEAMAASVPIVASDLEAHIDLVETTRAGVICRRAEDLADALEQMESDQGRAAGNRGRSSAMNLYGTWDDCAARYAELYGELTGR